MKKIILAAVLLSAAACKKSVDAFQEIASIMIDTPIVNETVNTNDSVIISGTISLLPSASAGQKLHGYEITVRKQGDTAKLCIIEDHIHASSVHFRKAWFNTTPSGTRLTANIKSFIDHEGNYVERSVVFVSE